jgi:hypothetical protein
MSLDLTFNNIAQKFDLSQLQGIVALPKIKSEESSPFINKSLVNVHQTQLYCDLSCIHQRPCIVASTS